MFKEEEQRGGGFHDGNEVRKERGQHAHLDMRREGGEGGNEGGNEALHKRTARVLLQKKPQRKAERVAVHDLHRHIVDSCLLVVVAAGNALQHTHHASQSLHQHLRRVRNDDVSNILRHRGEHDSLSGSGDGGIWLHVDLFPRKAVHRRVGVAVRNGFVQHG